MRLHHYGVIVRNLDAGRTHYEALGAELVGQVYDDPVQQAHICFLKFVNTESLIELIAPYSSQALVANFLDKHGGGLHHSCYMVANLDGTLARFRAQGAIIVFEPKPAVAFGGRLIAFMYLRDHTLIELINVDPSIEPVSLLARG